MISGHDEADALSEEARSVATPYASARQKLAVVQVLQERLRQFDKWGKQHHTPEWWLAILMEEVGELAECILHGKFGGPEAKNLGKELVQVAAVALAMIEDGI